MKFRHSLRFRILSTFCLFTALLGIIYAFFAFVLIHQTEDNLFNRHLHDEAEQYLARCEQNRHTPLPTSQHLTAYVGKSLMPPEIRRLVSGIDVGFHEFEEEDIHIAVQPLSEREERLYLVYNVASLETSAKRMRKVGAVLAVGIILIIGLALALGIIISKRIYAPIAYLAKQVDKVDPNQLLTDLSVQCYDDEVGILARALEQAIQRIKTYSRALNHELEEGREIQQYFLPRQLPRKTGWEIRALLKPARKMSGDFYDLFELPGNHLAFVIADVCGKGAGAALFTGLVQSLIQIYSAQEIERVTQSVKTYPTYGFHNKSGDQPGLSTFLIDIQSVIENTNRYIAENHGDTGMFATLFMGILNTTNGVITYINCGHEPPYILDSSGIKEKLKSSGLPIGVLPDAKFKVCNIHLNVGDLLVGYTDGIPEARSPEDKMFTRKHFELILNNQVNPSLQEMLETIKLSVFDHIKSAPLEDDITILALQRLIDKV